MNTFLIRMNLEELRDRLSRYLRCPCSLADARSILLNAGFVESSLGWLTRDMRPLMIAFYAPRGGLV